MTTKANMMVIMMMVLLAVAMIAIVAYMSSQALVVDWDLPGTLRYCAGGTCTL